MSMMPSRKPVLLVLTSTYPRWQNDPEPGFVHELSKRLTAYFRVIVLCPHAPGVAYREELEGVEVVRYRYGPARFETLVNDGGIITNLKRAKWKWLLVPGFVLSQAYCAWRLVRTDRVDVVHAHWLIPQGVIAALLQSVPGRKVPFIATSHGSDINVLQGRALDAMKRMVIRIAGKVTVVSDALRDSLTNVGRGSVDVVVQPMGVDLSNRFVPEEVLRDEHEVLFVGRLVPGKGVDKLIHSMSIMVALGSEARLTIVGHGPEEARLKRFAIDLGIADRISFAGSVAQAQLPGFYRRAGVFVAPFGRGEGFGLVLVEAIGCGCPVIASDTPAANFILGQEFADLTVDCDDPHALAKKVMATLSDPAGARWRANRLRAHVLERFDWPHTAIAYANLLADIMRRGHSHE